MPPAFAKLPLIDGHVHFAHPSLMPGLMQVMDENQVQKCNLVCTPHRTRLSLVPDALFVKAHHPQRVYVFGGLDISPLFIAPDACGTMFASYVDQLLDMGCDGVKMIEGKPDMRKMLPIPPFDSPAYEPYWVKLEQEGVPLIFHVNDPEEFWDAERIPEWARSQGWFYGDGTFIDNEAQYTEVLHVLERHPDLKVIFAHFFFLSNQLPRLAGLLDRFPNMHVDLTPGIEMYYNLGRQVEQAREFFLAYQERILYGTDIGAKALLGTPGMSIESHESSLRVRVVRSFLEKEGEYRIDVGDGFLFGRFAGPYRGIHLPEEALCRIYAGNFERLVGTQPRGLNPTAIVSECERLQMMIPMMGAAQPGVEMDLSVAGQVGNYFKNS